MTSLYSVTESFDFVDFTCQTCSLPSVSVKSMRQVHATFLDMWADQRISPPCQNKEIRWDWNLSLPKNKTTCISFLSDNSGTCAKFASFQSWIRKLVSEWWRIISLLITVEGVYVMNSTWQSLYLCLKKPRPSLLFTTQVSLFQI